MKTDDFDRPDDTQALRNYVEKARQGVLMDKEKLRERRAPGRMRARERIVAFCDEGSFREVGLLAQAAHESDLDAHLDAPADGMIVGSGRVNGRHITITANDADVLGGSSGTIGMQKLKRTVRRAIDWGTPIVRMLEGGGHRVQEGQDARHFAGSIGAFQELCDASGWVPMVVGIFGPGFAGPANHAALSDFVVMVRNQATLGMAGPALVKAGTGEVIDKETLGGASVQADKYGIADLAVDSEAECLAAMARFLSYLPANSAEPLPVTACEDPQDRRCEELLDIVPANLRRAYDVRDVVSVIMDRDSVFEIKPTYARNMFTGFARLGGRPVGVLANNPKFLAGTLNASACEKAAHFISLCDAYGVPLVYLIDVPGFAIGSGAEQTKLARRSAKLIYELGNATVARVSVVLRKGYGLGYYAMCGGRLFEPDGCVAWPTAEICAMSVEGAVDLVYRKDIEGALNPSDRRSELIRTFKARLGPLRAAEHFGIDDVIDPAHTRQYLIETLSRAKPRRNRARPPKIRSISPI